MASSEQLLSDEGDGETRDEAEGDVAGHIMGDVGSGLDADMEALDMGDVNGNSTKGKLLLYREIKHFPFVEIWDSVIQTHRRYLLDHTGLVIVIK